MQVVLLCTLITSHFVKGTAWVFEPIKPLSNVANQLVKKSSVPEKPVLDVDNKQLLRSSDKITYKYKQGVEKLLDFLGAGQANDDKSANKNNTLSRTLLNPNAKTKLTQRQYKAISTYTDHSTSKYNSKNTTKALDILKGLVNNSLSSQLPPLGNGTFPYRTKAQSNLPWHRGSRARQKALLQQLPRKYKIPVVQMRSEIPDGRQYTLQLYPYQTYRKTLPYGWYNYQHNHPNRPKSIIGKSYHSVPSYIPSLNNFYTSTYPRNIGVNNTPLYRQTVQKYGGETGRPYVHPYYGFRYRRVAISNRKRTSELQSPRDKVTQKTPLPLPLASIMTAARIVVPARPYTINGAFKSTVESIQDEKAEQLGARAVR